jgi:hypothetical protein
LRFLLSFSFFIGLLFTFWGCDDNASDRNLPAAPHTTDYAPDANASGGEYLLNGGSFEEATWATMSSGACTLAASTLYSTDQNASLLTTDRIHLYDGPALNLTGSLEAEKTYIIRGFLKRTATTDETFRLMAKLGSGTYRELNRVAVNSDDWTKFRGFLRLSAAEAAEGVQIYLNTTASTQDFFLDGVTVSTTSYTPPQASPAGVVHTSGSSLLDESGQPLRLKGINLIAYNDDDGTPVDEFLASSYFNFDRSDFDLIKAMGFNSVRLALWYRFFESSDATPTREAGFEWLDTVIGWAKEAGVYVVLDMHAPQGGGFQGPGNVTDFWSGSAYKSRFVALWETLAARYKNEPAVAAYDLINEPCAPAQADYLALLETTITAIRAVDSQHMINVELDFSDDAEPFLLENHANILYDLHFYDPWGSFTDDDTSVYGSDLTRADLQTLFEESTGFYLDANVPLQISEFGQRREVYEEKNASGWIGDVMDMMDENGVSYHYFAFKGNVFGVYDSTNAFAQNSGSNAPLITLFTQRQ